MNSRRRANAASEAGVTLVELMVALLVLGVVMAGLAAITISTLRVTVVNDTRTVASNMVQSELERVHALSFDQLSVVGRTETTRNGYVVVRDTSWVSLDTDTDICAEPAASVDTAMVRVDVSVRPDVPSGEPSDEITASTTISRPPIAPATNVGALSVLVLDHQVPPSGTGSVLVTVRGLAPGGGMHLQTTPSSGCVLFTDLSPGDYEVELQRTGHVSDGLAAGRATPTFTANVVAGARTSIEALYAPSARLRTTWIATDGDDVVLPTERPVTLARNDNIFQTVDGDEVAPLFPAPWAVWAGDCPAADPEGIDHAGNAYWSGASRQDPAVLAPSTLVEVEAPVAAVRWALDELAGDVAGPLPITIVASASLTSASDEVACLNGTDTLAFPAVSIDAGGLDPAGTAILGLPAGRWELQASSPVGTRTSEVVVEPGTEGIIDVEVLG